jgi:hypothetical protein
MIHWCPHTRKFHRVVMLWFSLCSLQLYFIRKDRHVVSPCPYVTFFIQMTGCHETWYKHHSSKWTTTLVLFNHFHSYINNLLTLRSTVWAPKSTCVNFSLCSQAIWLYKSEIYAIQFLLITHFVCYSGEVHFQLILELWNTGEEMARFLLSLMSS